MRDKRDKELSDIYRKRLRDRAVAKTRRQKQLENYPRRLGDLLTQYFKEDEQALIRIEESKAIMAWDKYVGHAAAKVSQALRVRGSKLIVRVDDPLWMQQLSLVRHELLKKYRAAFPKLGLTDIFLVRR